MATDNSTKSSRSCPSPFHPLLPPLQEREDAAWARAVAAHYAVLRAAQMASDGQVEEKPASGPPRPIEIVRQWEHLPNPGDGANQCPQTGKKTYKGTQEMPDFCDVCGESPVSRGIVERDVETGDIYRRDGKAVPRERKEN